MKHATVPYIYEWTQLSTGMKYVGSKTKKGWNPTRHMEYICSSKVVKPLILSNPADWTYAILMTGNEDECRYIADQETMILKKINARDDRMYYNQHNNDGVYSRTGISHTQHTKELYRQSVLTGRHNFVGDTNPSHERVKNHTHHLIGNKIHRVGGKTHYKYNHTKFQWKNDITGDSVTMTHAELTNTYDLDHSAVGRLIRRERKTHMGWKISEVIINEL